jgi:hypothetical protein
MSAGRAAAWITAAAVVGFTVSAFFAGLLRWERTAFIVPHALAAAVLVFWCLRSARLAPSTLLASRWRVGLVGGAAVSALLALSVLRQPAGDRPEGVALAFSLLWVALVYGGADAVLLNVLPALAVWRASSAPERPTLAAHLLALGASLAVTAAYHLGFPEFRGGALAAPLIGNGLITAAYLLTRSPIAPVAGHVAMHAAAVLHGMETAVQLPPHYPS